MLFKSHEIDLDNDSYLKILSHGGLITPSKRLAGCVCDSFAILDLLEKDLLASELPIQKVAIHVLDRYRSISRFVCDNHEEWGFKFAIKFVVNIFFNNLQKQAKDTVRKEVVKTFKKDKERSLKTFFLSVVKHFSCKFGVKRVRVDQSGSEHG